MKTPFLFITIAAALLSGGCGKNDSAAPAAGGTASAGPREIEITANDTMKYSVTSIEAKPGEDLDVVLTNAGSMPLEVMGHNWILLKSGSDAAAFSLAGSTHKETGYIAPELKDQVIAHIELLGPRKSGEAKFKAPSTPGDYPFLCSFPAHYQNGMHGVLTVK